MFLDVSFSKIVLKTCFSFNALCFIIFIISLQSLAQSHYGPGGRAAGVSVGVSGGGGPGGGGRR